MACESVRCHIAHAHTHTCWPLNHKPQTLNPKHACMHTWQTVNPNGCSHKVVIRLMRDGHVVSNGTQARCTALKGQAPPAPAAAPVTASTPSPAPAHSPPLGEGGRSGPDANSSLSLPSPQPPAPGETDEEEGAGQQLPTEPDPAPAKPAAGASPVPPPPDAPPPPPGDALRRRHAGSRRSGVSMLQALGAIAAPAQDGGDVNVPHGVATAEGAGGGGDGEGGGNALHAVCSVPDESGACEVYRLSYVAHDWGVWVQGMPGARKGFILIVLVDGEQVSQSAFRPDVYPPPSYPWFNSSSLQAPTDDWYFVPLLVNAEECVCVCVCVCVMYVCILGNTATSCT